MFSIFHAGTHTRNQNKIGELDLAEGFHCILGIGIYDMNRFIFHGELNPETQLNTTHDFLHNPNLAFLAHRSLPEPTRSFITKIYIASLKGYNSEVLPTPAQLNGAVFRLCVRIDHEE